MRQDRIRIPITEQDELTADAVASFRQHRKQEKKLKHNGLGSYDTDYRGALAEVALAKYLGITLPRGWKTMTEEDDHAQGCDMIADDVKWHSRSRQNPHGGLLIPSYERTKVGRYALMLTNDINNRVVWLAGWIECAEARKAAKQIDWYGSQMLEVPQGKLAPFKEKAAFGSLRNRLKDLIDMDTRFFCDECRMSHPIREHRICRGGTCVP